MDTVRTTPRLVRHVLSGLVGLAFVFSSITFGITVASAEDCPPGTVAVVVQVSDNPIRYETQCVDSGDDGDDGGDDGGGGGSECDLIDPFTYCNGGDRCYQSEWHPPWAMPPEPKPNPDSEPVIENCATPPSTAVTSYPVWSDDVPDVPPLEDQAWSAFGELAAPPFDLRYGPAALSYVGTDTYFWVEGPGDGEIIGSSAFTVVAIATPDHVEVDPGDGSGVVNCGWATSETDDCVRTYVDSSVGGGTTDAAGTPSYAAQARLIYDVRFENAGAPLNLPGLPTTLESAWVSAAVPVGEVQVIVE